MTMITAHAHCNDEEHDHIDTVVADEVTVQFCEHGFAQIALRMAGAPAPYAVAYLNPRSVTELAAMCFHHAKAQGHG